MKTYKFYNQTAKKTINIFDSVSLSFDYSNNHKDNVYLGFNLYTSRFDDPIILNVIENINSSITNEYGIGSSFYLDYSVTISSNEQYITLTYPHGETELFIKEGDSNKYISEYKTHYIDTSDNKIEIKLDNMKIIFDSNTNLVNYLFVKDNKEYKVNYASNISFYYNELQEASAVTKTNGKVTSITSVKYINNVETTVNVTELSYDNNGRLSQIKKRVNGSTAEYVENISIDYQLNSNNTSYILITNNITTLTYKIFLGYSNNKYYVTKLKDEIGNETTISYINNYQTNIVTPLYTDNYYLNDDNDLMFYKHDYRYYCYSYRIDRPYLLESKSRGVYFKIANDGGNNNFQVEKPDCISKTVYRDLTCPIPTFINNFTMTSGTGLSQYTIKLSFVENGNIDDVVNVYLAYKVFGNNRNRVDYDTTIQLKYIDENENEHTVDTYIKNNIRLSKLNDNWNVAILSAKAKGKYNKVNLNIQIIALVDNPTFEISFNAFSSIDCVNQIIKYDNNTNKPIGILGNSKITYNSLDDYLNALFSKTTVNSYGDDSILLQVDGYGNETYYDYNDANKILSKETIYKDGTRIKETNEYQDNEFVTQTYDMIDTVNYMYDTFGRLFKSVLNNTHRSNLSYKDYTNDLESLTNGEGNSYYETIENTYNMSNILNMVTGYEYEGVIFKVRYRYYYDSHKLIYRITLNDSSTILNLNRDSYGRVYSYNYGDSNNQISQSFNGDKVIGIYNNQTQLVNISYLSDLVNYIDVYDIHGNNENQRNTYIYDDYKRCVGNNITIDDNVVYECRTNYDNNTDYKLVSYKTGSYKRLLESNNIEDIEFDNIVKFEYDLAQEGNPHLFFTLFNKRLYKPNDDNQVYDISASLNGNKVSVKDSVNEVTYLRHGLRLRHTTMSNNTLNYQLDMYKNMTTLFTFMINQFSQNQNTSIFTISGDATIVVSYDSQNHELHLRYGDNAEETISVNLNLNVLYYCTLNVNYKDVNSQDVLFKTIVTLKIHHPIEKTINIEINNETFTGNCILSYLKNAYSYTDGYIGNIIISQYFILSDSIINNYVNRLKTIYQNNDTIPSQFVRAIENRIDDEDDIIIPSKSLKSLNGVKPVEFDASNLSSSKLNNYFDNIYGFKVYACRNQKLVYSLNKDRGYISLYFKHYENTTFDIITLYNENFYLLITNLGNGKISYRFRNNSTVISNIIVNGYETLTITWDNTQVNYYRFKAYIGNSQLFNIGDGWNNHNYLYAMIGKNKENTSQDEYLYGYIYKIAFGNIYLEDIENKHLSFKQYEYVEDIQDKNGRIDKTNIKGKDNLNIRYENSYQDVIENNII